MSRSSVMASSPSARTPSARGRRHGDEIRVTVIATGFDDARSMAQPLASAAAGLAAGAAPGTRTVDLKSYRGGERPSPWRRPRADGVRADGLEAMTEDLDIPAFLRRQAD